MSNQFIDLTGQKFNRLTVVSIHSRNPIKWKCVCDCGNKSIVKPAKLKNGTTKSCGCFNKERFNKMITSHGMTGIPEQNIWSCIKARCLNKDSHAYPNYGGRGIDICDRWKNSFQSFMDDLGDRPTKKHSIERFDNNKGYNPCNCYWATRKAQANNRRSNRFITHNGIKRTVSQWSDIVGIKTSIIRQRLDRHNWPVEKALFEPPKR